MNWRLQDGIVGRRVGRRVPDDRVVAGPAGGLKRLLRPRSIHHRPHPLVVAEQDHLVVDVVDVRRQLAVRFHGPVAYLRDLASLALDRIRLTTREQTAISIATQPTVLRRQAFDLFGIDPPQKVPITVTGPEAPHERRAPMSATGHGDHYGWTSP